MSRALVLVGILFVLVAAIGCGSDTPATAPVTPKQLEKEKAGPGGSGVPRSK